MRPAAYRTISGLLADGPLTDRERSHLSSFLDDYFSSVPFWVSLGTRSLAWILYLGPILFIGRPRTLGGLHGEDRTAYLRAWEKSTTYMVRQLYTVLKMIASIGYGSNPEFHRSIGYPQPHRHTPS